MTARPGNLFMIFVATKFPNPNAGVFHHNVNGNMRRVAESDTTLQGIPTKEKPALGF
jgi:hypothetical protein